MTCYERYIFFVLLSTAFLTCLGCLQKENAYVTVMLPVHKKVTRYLEATGTAVAVESVEILARVQGFLESIHFKPRSRVKAGDLLFVIDPRPFQAKVHQAAGALQRKEANLKLAQIELDKSKELYDKAAVSEIKLIERTAQRDMAAADVETAKADLEAARLELAYTQVEAPINGRVSRNYVDVGNLVGAGEKTLLTKMYNDDSIYVYFNLSELDVLPVIRKYSKDLADIPPGQRLEASPTPVYIGLADEEGYPHEGRVDFSEPAVDTGTGTLQVRAAFPNPTGLIFPGMFVRVRIPVKTEEALLVPDVAVQADQGGRYLLVVNDKNVVEQRYVTRGPRVDRMQVIEKGLDAKDRVIVKGVQRARPGTKVNPIQASQPKPEPGPEKSAEE